MRKAELVIIGGGPAGMAAAVSARQNGIENIVILERDHVLGGILNQCIHNGFGLHTFQEELTGPEYADRYEQKVKELEIEYQLETMVTDISEGTDQKASDLLPGVRCIHVSAVNRTYGFFQIETKAVILAMGCRERPRGALNIPGYRPAGIYSAGTAQRLINVMGYMPGKRVVILGSGDIGLIMARRMTLEGAKVLAVAELMPYSGGLKRNIVQCLEDYDIPLLLSHTVVNIRGKERVEGITLAKVDEKGRPLPGTQIEYECDTLLLSCGLLPENELSKTAGVALQQITGGPAVNDRLETSIPGMFACGNVLHVHDLVDYVSEEASLAGKYAACYIQKAKEEPVEDGTKAKERAAEDGTEAKEEPAKDGTELEAAVTDDTELQIQPENGVRYTVPCSISPDKMADQVVVRFRVGGVYQDRYISVYLGEQRLLHAKRRILTPGKMEQVILKKSFFQSVKPDEAIRIDLEEE
ncbi:MAG: FAD-dependent oxidoreductase [Lachnospiraceae bacterium]|nr:FAD-dependent oxidoreductase [Lachnospiraceae bacterium]